MKFPTLSLCSFGILRDSCLFLPSSARSWKRTSAMASGRDRRWKESGKKEQKDKKWEFFISTRIPQHTRSLSCERLIARNSFQDNFSFVHFQCKTTNPFQMQHAYTTVNKMNAISPSALRSCTLAHTQTAAQTRADLRDARPGSRIGGHSSAEAL